MHGKTQVALVEDDRLRQMEEVMAAARRYRDLMRWYLAEQAGLVARGASLDEMVRSNWERFGEAADAEEELFVLLDDLDAGQT
ncbi:MAG: hypothetical protein LC793_23090 [Thermomicrobia bacterium]|nr:hypothetical protein [Thermomicrobia bacterium]